MIGFFLQAALGAIGPQTLPPSGCAAYLWSRGTPPRLVAMASGTLRLSIDGKPVDLARTAAEGVAARDVPAGARFAAGDITATLQLSAVERPDLADGAVVPDGLLTVARAGADTIVAPVAGLIGCAPAK